MSDAAANTQAGLSLPKGGGAIKGIGETFQANLFSGTANHSVPIATSAGRNGFGPKLSLDYSSGNGNGIFGLGWQLSLPRITRKTEKGLPRYDDSDVYVMSGSEDLVRVLRKSVDTATGRETWTPEDPVVRGNFSVFRYRPRTEGLFARVERWVNNATGETHWRAISKDNVTSVFGATAVARIADPENAQRIYEWLLQEVFDAYGNSSLYEYAADDPVQQLAEMFEQRRATTQRYIRRIYYGNLPTPLVDAQQRPLTYSDGSAIGHLRNEHRYAFEVVFDYGDWETPTLLPHPVPFPTDQLEVFGANLEASTTHRPVPFRGDRFSHFRAGFDIRTLRRCSRVLMFHHFAELGGPTLVRSTDFGYSVDPDTELSLLSSVTVTGYDKDEKALYRSASMPSVEFSYAAFKPQEQRYQSLKAVGDQMPPLPLNDPNMTLVDLFGDGLPDILHTGAGGFRYWRNLGEGTFDRPRTLAQMPAGLSLDQPGIGFGDMQGNGTADLLVNTGSLPGFFETTFDGTWKRFTPYESFPSFVPQDPNLHMVDLTGDGRADALITDDRQFLWFECLGAKGFAAPKTIARIHDLDRFPDVFFGDPSGRVRLADMTGDGLNDIVLIHNGGMDYWPNLGYGRFGRRVSMANAPRLDLDFDPKRLFLVDLNGTGCADLIYVDAHRVYFWFNRSGNAWSGRQTIAGTPTTTDASAVQFADIFGSGTTSLVWSRAFDGSSDGNYKALDFCGGIKPYVLHQVDNNLGATTRVSYAPSTRFFLEDHAQGKPWLSMLPFPVQVVDKIEVIDHVSKTKHVSTYKYHHGHYDGREREFCGFGRVDEFDTESFADFSQPGLFDENLELANANSAYHVPPVETRTWFHTGIYFDDRGSQASDYLDLTERFRQEYYRQDTEAIPLIEHGVDASDTPAEAYRALRGAQLRKEVHSHDGSSRADHPYEAEESRYQVALLQAKASNNHAVYFSHQVEHLSYHYERNPVDPRVSHDLTLEVDAFGNPQRTLAIGYGRRRPSLELPTSADQARQTQSLITYTEHRYTNAIDALIQPDVHRTPLSSETLTYELTGFLPANGAKRFSLDEWTGDGFGRIENAQSIGYEQQANPAIPQKRLIEHVRTYYRKDDLTDLLPLGVLEPLALPGDTQRQAFSSGLLNDIYGNRVDTEMLTGSGYVVGEDQATWWLPSGQVFYSPQSDTPADELRFAQQHFFAAFRARDPFGNTTLSIKDPYVLLTTEIIDALQNRTRAEHDYRTLEPFRLTDINGNRSEVAFDTLGLVVGSAVMGKAGETLGDSLAVFDANLSVEQRNSFFADPLTNAASLCGSATTRIVYDLARYRRDRLPIVAAMISRESHLTNAPPDAVSKAQVALSYSDGFGREVQKKIPAEPGPVNSDGPVIDSRWVGSGWTVFNNKGKPVRKFEPFFDDTHEFRFDQRVGVSSTLFYDPIERVVAKLHPNRTWEKVVFDPWKQTAWDVNDTILIADPKGDADVGGFFQSLSSSTYLPSWYAARIDGSMGDAERSVAEKTAKHAGTPSIAHADVLGRKFLSIAHNRIDGNNGAVDELQTSRVILDIEGNEREVIDAQGRIVMRYDFDMLGTHAHHTSMEAGERWMLRDIGGQAAFAWDSRGHRFRNTFDALRRPQDSFMQEGGNATNASPEKLIGRTLYGEAVPASEASNLRGKVHQHFDQAGLITNEAYDFKGNLLSASRQLTRDYKTTIDWSQNPQLDPEVFLSRTEYDALNRAVSMTSPDKSITRPRFDRAGALETLDVQLQGQDASTPFITQIERDAKGQRKSILYGNGVRTLYDYDPLTLNLSRRRTLRGVDVLQDLHYSYDPVGNIVAIEDDAQQTVYFANQVVTPDADYTYDAVYRLLTAGGREHIGKQTIRATTWHDEFRAQLPQPGDGKAMQRYLEEYSYDATGNILQLTHQVGRKSWIRKYHYRETSLLEPGKASNRLTSVATDKHKQKIYPYDEHGNMTALPHLSAMFWDFHNQLKQANLNGHGTAYYVYAADGQRVRKVVEKNGGALIEERITLGGFEVFRRRKATGSISLERQTLHVMDDRERIALIETRTQGEQLNVPAQGIRYQFGNHLGSAVLELDDNGRMISYEEYYPYGSTSYQAGRSAAEVSLKRFRFTGMERDEETGLNHHGARYYAPWLARWTSADPVGLRGGINHYEYGKCCPTAFIDRAGTEPHKQLTLAEQKKFEITPVATRTGRGITKSQHKALRGIQDAFGPKGQMHWGHPSDNTHGTTRAGASPPLRPQPASENMSLGGGADKVAKQAARSRGEFTRNAAGVDTTVSADAKYKQPPPRSFEKPMGDYEESIARRTPPAQVPRAPTSSAPSSAPPHEQLELPFNKPPAPKAAPVAPVPQSSPLKTGLKAGATAAASIVIFLGLNYLVHKELQAQLDRDLTTIRSGARPMAEHAKARDPDQPVYFRFQVESRDSSYFIPFAGWLPNPPELHVIQFALSSTPVAPVTTVENHLSFWHASTTTRVTYTELAIP